MTDTITRDALKRRLDAGERIVLVEALPEKYFAEAHLPGAVRINPDEVSAKAPALLPDKDARIVVYCADAACGNSAKAVANLVGSGYTNVFEYADGKRDWIDAGLPTEAGA